MNVIEPEKTNNEVKVSSLTEGDVFRRQGRYNETYGYYVLLDVNSDYFDLRIRPHIKLGYETVWVFNIKTDTLGIFDADEMVEPVELEVIVKEKE